MIAGGGTERLVVEFGKPMESETVLTAQALLPSRRYPSGRTQVPGVKVAEIAEPARTQRFRKHVGDVCGTSFPAVWFVAAKRRSRGVY